MAQAEIQTSFVSGELSPNLYARVDLAKFESGAALLRNFLVDYRGGVTYRPGTQFLDDLTLAGLTGTKRCVGFIVSTDATYVLVFSNLSIRIYNLGTFVISVATPYAAADLAGLKFTQSADVLTIVHPSYPPANLSRTTPSTFSYDLIVTGPAIGQPTINSLVAPHGGPYSFGYLVTAVDQDGKEESLPSAPAVKHSLAMDETKNQVIFLTWDAPSEAVSLYNVYKWGPNDFNTTVVGTSWGFIGTAQASAFTDNNIAPDFSRQPPSWGDPFSGGQIVGVTLIAPGSGYTGTSADWPTVPYIPLVITGDGTGAAGYAVVNPDSDTVCGGYLTDPGKGYTTAAITADGLSGSGATFDAILTDIAPVYPACVGYVQQRRTFAGALSKPETLIMSQVGLYNNFNKTPISLATDAISYSISGEQVNSIKALIPVAYGLLTFTTGGTYLINGGSPYAAITPASIAIQAQSSVGANDLQPLRVSADILYVQNKGNRARNLAFAWQKQTYQGSDISALAAHLFDTYTMPEWCWAEEPFKIVWAVRDDGKLLSLTYVPDQEVIAWARHDTQGQFVSICSVPENGHDTVYVIVDRYVPMGETDPCLGWRSYLERFDASLADCVEHSWHLDSAVRLAHNDGSGSVCFSAVSGQATMTLCEPAIDLNIDSLTLTWAFAGSPTLDWVRSPGVVDHFNIYHNTLPDWTTATLIATVGTTVRTYNPSGSTDGTPNYWWVIGFNSTETASGIMNGVQGCYNSGEMHVGPSSFAPTTQGQTFTVDAPFAFTLDTVNGLFDDYGEITSIVWSGGSPGVNPIAPPVARTLIFWNALGGGSSTYIDADISSISSGNQTSLNQDRTGIVPVSWFFRLDSVCELSTAGGSWGNTPTIASFSNAVAAGKLLFRSNPAFVGVSDSGSGGPGGIGGSATLLSVNDVVLAGCAKAEVLALNLDGTYSVNIVGTLAPFIIPNDPDDTVRPILADEWEWVTPTDIITGLDHLIGKEVWALMDGIVYGPTVPTIGAIELPAPASNVLVGLLYQGQVKTLYLTVDGIQPGTIQGKRKLITGTTARVDNSLGLKSGANFDQLSAIPDLVPPTTQPVLGFTGDTRNIAYPDWNTRGEVCIQQDLPLPATILGIIVEVTPGDTGR